MEIKAFLNIYSTVHRFKTSSDTTLFPRSQTSLFVLKTWAQLSQPTIAQLFDYIALCRKNSWRREKAAIRGRDAFLHAAAVSSGQLSIQQDLCTLYSMEQAVVQY